MRLQTSLRLVLGCLCLAFAACSKDEIGKTLPVKGKVTLNGKSLTAGSVTFWPNEAKGNKSPHEGGGTIGADGTYEAYTKGKSGLPPGHYQVTIAANIEADSTKPLDAKSLVPSKYSNKISTPILVEVVENPIPGAYNFDVK